MALRLISFFLFAAGILVVSSAFQVSPRSNLCQSDSPWRKQHCIAESSAIIRTPQSQLASTASKEQDNEALPVDYDALLKYHAAIAIQMIIFAGLLTGIDSLVDLTGISVPFPITMALFYGLSLKSRVFNPLNNARPNIPQPNDDESSSSPGFRDRIMPSWTPPGLVFPIMWILIIGPLRAYSSALVVDTTGHFFDPAIMAFLFHLAVGDVWNTINNTEKRYGASVTGVLCVLVSLLNAAYQYSMVDAPAGNLLGLVVIWLSVASSLVTATWQLNPNPVTGEQDPLYPVQGQAKTEFVWFQKQQR